MDTACTAHTTPRQHAAMQARCPLGQWSPAYASLCTSLRTRPPIHPLALPCNTPPTTSIPHRDLRCPTRQCSGYPSFQSRPTQAPTWSLVSTHTGPTVTLVYVPLLLDFSDTHSTCTLPTTRSTALACMEGGRVTAEDVMRSVHEDQLAAGASLLFHELRALSPCTPCPLPSPSAHHAHISQPLIPIPIQTVQQSAPACTMATLKLSPPVPMAVNSLMLGYLWARRQRVQAAGERSAVNGCKRHACGWVSGSNSRWASRLQELPGASPSLFFLQPVRQVRGQLPCSQAPNQSAAARVRWPCEQGMGLVQLRFPGRPSASLVHALVQPAPCLLTVV